MRVKFIESTSLSELEATINTLLLEGWERDSTLMTTPQGTYLYMMVNYDRITSRGAILRGSYPTNRPMSPPPRIQPLPEPSELSSPLEFDSRGEEELQLVGR